MRFKRHQRFSFEDTERKRAALVRKYRLERDSLPLFAAEVTAAQLPADQVMAERAAAWERQQQARRDHLAQPVARRAAPPGGLSGGRTTRIAQVLADVRLAGGPGLPAFYAAHARHGSATPPTEGRRDMTAGGAKPERPLDSRVVELVRALALQAAREDHARELADGAKHEGGDLREVLDRPAAGAVDR